MQTIISDNIYITKFYYSKLPEHYFATEDGVANRSKMKSIANRKKVQRETKCVIYLLNRHEDGSKTLTEVSEGIVKCNPSDEYVKTKGRILAFYRALKNKDIQDFHVKKNANEFIRSYIDQCPASFDMIVSDFLRQG
jgi:hypothetical protein